jgi:hypothetical protein
MRARSAALAIALLGVISAPVSAGTVKVWKWVDDDGKVVYSAYPPSSGVTNVEEKNFDPNHNVIEMPVPPPSYTASPSYKSDSSAEPYARIATPPMTRPLWPAAYDVPPQPPVPPPAIFRAPTPSLPTPRMR